MNTYAKSGIDLKLYNELIKKVKPIIEKTKGEEVISEVGSFSALFDFSSLSKKYDHPVLVSSTDGVGTKLLIAQEVNKHDTIGIDLVAMCVNDLLAQGATPLFFLDYFATGVLNKNVLLSVIQGIAEGCKESKIALVGGETAEMPGMYGNNHYDLAGFVVGVVDRKQILPNCSIMKAGDCVVGLESNGIHSNGFSLVRHIFKSLDINYNDISPWNNKSWGEILLKPTKIYVDSLLPIMPKVKGIAHITGGGLIDNIPRILSGNLFVDININSWKWPDIFLWLKEEGKIEKREMLKTFNCGIGIVLIVDPDNMKDVESHFQKRGEKIEIIGKLDEACQPPLDRVVFS
ncbi:phosphoribosylformylglycinamidine cyclo-ligase [Wolbachia endosymbiont of Culex quinquefasciatus JHB]|uniref:phosphoribosylformylglycinamidine cyclo-ligase n=1 Tax=Wolbachia TaxID=953 RepID=UPI0001761F4C|nr:MULTISPECIES: phosphoribosylformylglycinamidine cyclo-ligase [Wolbachia]EEB56260.1 phosphoribosylformylglycinamidine cyclo-ligase [Wolbachia endosymbiont of Culex quinquefasciatus JHB]UXX39978.1 phosphoribosylformylglycinamidine cyclo-ligase [Wolbachia endosymbiont of Oryzaephilus surinamensis]CAQ54982.1 phosphoribosylformylglycinamidine cyclo-ligase [Wolbachia endosymbiont of Culex quinquefasciatus Pel]CQD09661.1 phosphoribosylaminoimidazole synthetase [Wolbachia endosymbiont wPip_Mol of Cu